MILAGLLTYSFSERPSRFYVEQWIEYCSKNLGGIYSSGSVQDSHLIPFSSFRMNIWNDTKIERKDNVNNKYWYSETCNFCGMVQNIF